MATWDGWTIIDGWNVTHTREGYTLTAQFFSKSRDHAPSRSSAVPVSGQNAVPPAFASYKVSEVATSPVSSVGPWVIQVTAKAGLGSSGVGNTGDTLLKTNSLSSGYMDFHMQPGWCGLRQAPASAKPTTVSGWNTGKWASAVSGDGPDGWGSWSAAAAAGNSISGSPFTRMVKPSLADVTMRFLQIEVSFYVKETKEGLSSWGGFSGIVPVNSMPAWITIPGGDNRWRLFDEKVAREVETDGRTWLFKVDRTLLGIPNAAKDCVGGRLQWSQDEIGQRDWNDL